MLATHKLTNLQLDLLKVFSIQLPQNQLEEIRDMLTNYFANKATAETDKLWEQNQWSQETVNTWLDEHLRTKTFEKK
jgi:hypothetical protein